MFAVRISRISTYFLPLFALLFVVYGCSSDRDDTTASSPEGSLQKGWKEYSLGKYSSAILEFESVLAQSEDDQSQNRAEAYNGLGWSYMNFSQSASINPKNIETAIGKFSEAIAHDETHSDAWVGYSTSLLIRRGTQADLRNAINAVDKALQGDSKYLYRHDYDSIADLYALKALCYYYLGEFGEASKEADRAVSIDENNRVALAIRTLL